MIYTNPKNGDTIESEMSLKEAATVCHQKGTSSFAKDLARKAFKYAPSESQSFWLQKIAVELISSPVKAPREPAANYQGIVSLLTTAYVGKKLPTVSFDLDVIGTVKFNLTGSRSKVPGSVSVSDGGNYGANIYYGTIAPNGDFFPSRQCTTEVKEFVWAFNSDPAGVSASYGKTSGNCCFCAAPITTDESKAVGYGPVCAKRYCLPWGSKA